MRSQRMNCRLTPVGPDVPAQAVHLVDRAGRRGVDRLGSISAPAGANQGGQETADHLTCFHDFLVLAEVKLRQCRAAAEAGGGGHSSGFSQPIETTRLERLEGDRFLIADEHRRDLPRRPTGRCQPGGGFEGEPVQAGGPRQLQEVARPPDGELRGRQRLVVENDGDRGGRTRDRHEPEAETGGAAIGPPQFDMSRVGIVWE